jgi:hypothetical protein
VLAEWQVPGLTDGAQPGKTVAGSGSKQGMTIHETRATSTWESPAMPVDIVEWRARRLTEAGFPAALADVLAHQRVDLHALLQLVDAGCPPELAARILSPVDDAGDPR